MFYDTLGEQATQRRERVGRVGWKGGGGSLFVYYVLLLP